MKKSIPQREVYLTDKGEFLTKPNGDLATAEEVMRYARSIPAWIDWADRGIP